MRLPSRHGRRGVEHAYAAAADPRAARPARSEPLRLRADGTTVGALAREQDALFLEDMRALGDTSVDRYTRGTDFIEEMVSQIQRCGEGPRLRTRRRLLLRHRDLPGVREALTAAQQRCR